MTGDSFHYAAASAIFATGRLPTGRLDGIIEMRLVACAAIFRPSAKEIFYETLTWLGVGGGNRLGGIAHGGGAAGDGAGILGRHSGDDLLRSDDHLLRPGSGDELLCSDDELLCPDDNLLRPLRP